MFPSDITLKKVILEIIYRSRGKGKIREHVRKSNTQREDKKPTDGEHARFFRFRYTLKKDKMFKIKLGPSITAYPAAHRAASVH